MSPVRHQPPPKNAQALREYLASADFLPVPIIHTDGKAIVLDLSKGSRALGESLAGLDVAKFGELVDRAMAAAGTAFAFGRYAEDRELYDNEYFAGGVGSDRRSIHMGLDLFCAAGTALMTPLDATVAITANNTRELDYGPMLVLRHSNGPLVYYTLYGHLDLDSIATLEVDQPLRAGDAIARVGSPPQNGNWPPHLHFQLILDLCGLGRDFPGVARPSEAAEWLALSPSPAMFFPECPAAQLNCPVEASRS